MQSSELRQLLTQPYDADRWHEVVDFVFPTTQWFAAEQSVPCSDDKVTSFTQCGNVRLADGRTLGLFEVRLDGSVNIARNRVWLRQLTSKFVDEASLHGVLAIYTQNEADYRFTFMAKDTQLTEEGQLVTSETSPKRYTYVLGPNEPCRTAAERFCRLHDLGESAELDHIMEAFSVERLNKEFFTGYKAQYERFVDALMDSDYRQTVFGIDSAPDDDARKQAEKRGRDFVKRLLGRIVFLHFVQKKGWLGCPPADSPHAAWLDGDPEFIQNLFRNAADPERFHSQCLIPLFHEALNEPNRTGNLFALTGTRIPYLNGGLFEPGDVAEHAVEFPAAHFEELLSFLGQYNFTIDENDPNEHEIGIDPEMLGHIFENLLEDNKNKGAFYTPKAIVEYMCRQTLIEYLKSHLCSPGLHPGPDDEKAAAIEHLVREKDRGDQDENSFILQNASTITQLLDDVKICDPAIGSGAFPIGLLQEIFWIKLALNWNLYDERARVKKQIIQNSIYGVDIDAGAVEIARLRFWLALIVDEDVPSPLPNLDFKIMQGNSLLESFHGVDLSQVQNPDLFKIEIKGQQEFGLVETESQLTLADETRQKMLPEMVKAYFAETDPEKKQDLHTEIDAEVRYAFELAIQHRREQLQGAIRHRKKHAHTKKQIASVAAMIAELKQLDDRLKELAALQDEPERPYFLWHLFFQDVFEQGGFDIVIANPPYVRQEAIRSQKAALKEHYNCYTGTADLFVYFYEQSVNLLRDGGVLTYITSNKYYRAAYGEKLRAFLASQLTLQHMVDFGDAPVFDAIAYASIVIGRKQSPSEHHAVKAYTWQSGDVLPTIAGTMKERAFPVSQNCLTPDGWRLDHPAVFSLLEKLKAAGTPLGEYVDGRFYRGILTGFNEAFVVDRATRDRLIAEDPKSEEILKPFLRGRDVKRWKVDSQDLWLIFTRRGINIEEYPAIKSHLQRFRDALEPRPQDWPSGKEWLGRKSGPYEWYEIQDNIAYWQEFERPKILYPDIYEHQSFAWDESGAYSVNTTYFIPTDEKWLTSLLNSLAVEWFYAKTSNQIRGGYMRSFSTYIQRIPIPGASDSAKARLTELAQRAAKAEGPDLEVIETEINQIVYPLFALTPDEIALVEGAAD